MRCLKLLKSLMYKKCFGNTSSQCVSFTVQSDTLPPLLSGVYIWEFVNRSYLSLELSSYPGNRVISKTLRESFNNSSNLENFSSLWSKGLLSQMSTASSISWIVTPNTLFLSGCFHHLLYTLASPILRFVIILCPPSLASIRHRCRHRLSSILGLTTVRPRINGVWCL